MTIEQIKAATGASTPTAQKFIPYLLETFDKYEINTPKRQLCFLSQIGHESGGLFYTEELASGVAYENRADLGNTQAGDGVKYKGRGLIQITGRANYKALSTAFNEDFINNPTLLGAKNSTICTPEQLKYATLSAGWFWTSRKLNDCADTTLLETIVETDTANPYRTITKRINGGYTHYKDRILNFNKGLPLFK
jgi:putative chitinase